MTSEEQGVNHACTPARRHQAVVNRLGPFCLPPDAIRAIDHPRFTQANRVRFLDPAEPVVALRLRGKDRAYPVRILVWHEIVNDRVAGVPVAVTFCPLCNSAVAFDRRVASRVLRFGVSGRLASANLLMFDRQTETLWHQLTGEVFRGPLGGHTLRRIPAQMVAFSDFRRWAPRGAVMNQNTGLEAAYGRDPYAGYGSDPAETSSFLFGAATDPRLPPKTRILGLATNGDAVAVVYPSRRGGPRVVPVRLAGRDVVVLLRWGTGLPATAGTFEEQPKGWSGPAYRARTGGRRVELAVAGRHFVDTRTGSTFDLRGRALSGQLAGTRLRPVAASDAFWFAWSRFHPDTRVVRA